MNDFCITCYEMNFVESPVWNGSACVPCPESTQNWDRAAGECVPACPVEKPIWNGFECVDCSVEYPFGDYPFWNPMTEKCVDKCPTGTLASSSTCLTCAEATENERPFWDPATAACVGTCKESSQNGLCLPCDANEEFSTPYWDTKERKCTTCPDEKLWDPNLRECVTECTTSQISGERVCQPCRDAGNVSEVLWNGASCVACPQETPKWNIMVYRCESPCQPSQYWDGSACVSAIAYCP